MARFPDSQVNTSRLAFPSAFALRATAKQWLFSLRGLPDDDVTLAAYSGGTVWVSHPLRLAAGVSVRVSLDANMK